MGHLLYAQHFLLLTCFSLLLAVMTRLQVSSGLAVAFAAYGALHASALVLTLRVREPIWRMGIFIAISAALSLMTLRVGIIGMQLSGALPGNVGFYLVLGFSAMTGAVTYGILIRLFGIHELSLWEIGGISIGCMLATYVAIITLTHSHFLGRWWLAVLWWYAFSGSLWYFDQREYAACQPRRE